MERTYVVVNDRVVLHGPTTKEDADRYATLYGGRVQYVWKEGER